MDHVRTEISVCAAPAVCVGALASYACRRIAFHAGAFAPGIQDAVFDELHHPSSGASIGEVHHWIGRRRPLLLELGYRLDGRLFDGSTIELLRWIEAGRGYRGGVIPRHRGAIGISVERTEPDLAGELVVAELTSDGPRRVMRTHELSTWRPPQALALHWIGWA